MLPLICEIFSNGFSIGLILSFNLSSDDAYAITSPPAFIVLFTPKPPLITTVPVVLDVESTVPSNVHFVPSCANTFAEPRDNDKLLLPFTITAVVPLSSSLSSILPLAPLSFVLPSVNVSLLKCKPFPPFVESSTVSSVPMCKLLLTAKPPSITTEPVDLFGASVPLEKVTATFVAEPLVVTC